MKATGIVRRIDDLGKVVIPKEIRRTMRIREGDPLEIYTDAGGEVIFKKYSPIGELSGFASQYADALASATNLTVFITDRDHCVAAAGISKKEALFTRSVDSMQQVMKVAAKEGVTVCCEAVNRFESPLVNTAAEAIKYADMVDSKNIGIHLDTYHMNIEENNIGDAIRLVGKRLRHFHTGENNRNVPGRGHLDWDEIFKALKDIDYKNDIVSEPFLMIGDEVGYDIRVWRPILENPTEERLDNEAKFLLEFTKGMMQKYGM